LSLVLAPSVWSAAGPSACSPTRPTQFDLKKG
jgi:hypothetical protein